LEYVLGYAAHWEAWLRPRLGGLPARAGVGDTGRRHGPEPEGHSTEMEKSRHHPD
jgi:hypothetical protein